MSIETLAVITAFSIALFAIVYSTYDIMHEKK